MDPRTRRITADIEAIKRLEQQTDKKIQILSQQGNPVNQIVVRVGYRTAGSKAYPGVSLASFDITISLDGSYPFVAPRARVSPLVFHPNVWENGNVCMGGAWSSTEFLDLFLLRIVRTLTFDPALTNIASPANREAASWYSATKVYGGAFPSDHVVLRKSGPGAQGSMSWRPV